MLIGVGFLSVRLPEELDRLDASFTEEYVVRSCVATPLEGRVTSLEGLAEPAPLGEPQRRNLLLVMLITQLVQVGLLAVAVWAFFVMFGSVAIGVDVQETWLGHAPNVLVSLGEGRAITRELLGSRRSSPPSPASTSPSTRSTTTTTARSSSARSPAAWSAASGYAGRTSRCDATGSVAQLPRSPNRPVRGAWPALIP